MEKYQNLNKQFINGEWKDGSASEVINVLNPFDESTITTFKAASKNDVDAAYKAAEAAAESWSKTGPIERRDILEKAAQLMSARMTELVEWLAKESGSSVIKSHIDAGASIEALKQAAAVPFRLDGRIIPSTVPNKESRIYRKPLGVIGVISPWNFPLILSMRSIAFAIATGNTVVIKPSDLTPVTGGTIMAKIFEEAGLPKGVFNVVVGHIAEISEIFVTHPIPRLISFTGSTPVGRIIGEQCGRTLKKVALELGGNNAFIVREDADIDYAVTAGIFGRYLHQGQICMSTNRFLIHESIYHEFAKKFTDRVSKLKFGDPTDPATVVGPLIQRKQVDRILKNLDLAVAAGATITTGGKAKGNLMEPTVVINATNEMLLSCEEIFGPVGVLIPFKDDADAIRLANASEFGLSGALHTKDLDKGVRMALEIKTGMIHVNDQTVIDEPHAIFGGEKSSGLGRFNGDYVVEEFTTTQWVTVQYEHRPFPY